MNIINRIIKRVKWNAPIEIIKARLSNMFEMYSEQINSEEDIMLLWDSISNSNILAAFDYIENQGLPFNQVKYKEPIKNMIINKASVRATNFNSLKEFANAFSILLISRSFEEKQIDLLFSLYNREQVEVLYNVIKNIDGLKNELYMVIICEGLSTIFLENEGDIDLLVSAFTYNKLDYHSLDEEKKTRIECIAKDSIQKGYFIWADRLLKGFNINIKEIDLISDNYIESLKKCDAKYFYRGTILLRDAFFSDDIDSWTKWYKLVKGLRADISDYELEGYRFMYVCSLIKLSPLDPKGVLREHSMNYSFNPFQYQRSRYARALREAVIALLENKSDFLIEFLKQLHGLNIDENIITNYKPRPNRIKKKIGLRDLEEYYELLLQYSSRIEDIIYIYLNTFLRGILSFDELIRRLSSKFNLQRKRCVQNIEIGGFLKEDKKNGCYFLSLNNLIGEKEPGVKDKRVYLIPDDNKFIEKCYIDNENSWIDAVLVDYDELNNKLYASIIKNDNHKKIENIIEDIKYISEEDIEANKKYYNSINFNTLQLRDKKLFWKLNSVLLDKFVESALNQKNVRSIIDYYQNINFFYFYIENISSNWKTTNINYKRYLPAIFEKINEYISKLKNAEIDIYTCFEIYSNSMMKRFMSLGEFLNAFEILDSTTKKAFFNKIPYQVGYVNKVVRHKTLDNKIVILIDCTSIFGYRIKSGIRERVECVKTCNLSSLKDSRKLERKRVRFSIVDYDGENTFTVSDIRKNGLFITR